MRSEIVLVKTGRGKEIGVLPGEDYFGWDMVLRSPPLSEVN
jgi:hypothetical protein